MYYKDNSWWAQQTLRAALRLTGARSDAASWKRACRSASAPRSAGPGPAGYVNGLFFRLRLGEQILGLMRRSAQILRRRLDLRTQPGGRVPRPARVVQHGARHRHHVGIARRQYRLGLFRLGDQADGDGRQPRLALDACRERQLVARPRRDPLQRRQAAAGHMHEMGAALLQLLREAHALLDLPAAVDP